ncbi:MAG TPA: hypothetical protein VGE62_00875 [Candidatus Paceibacterota bacterium]
MTASYPPSRAQHTSEIVPLDMRGRAVTLFIFDCQRRGFGPCGYNMLNRIIAPKTQDDKSRETHGWWIRTLSPEELERIPDHWTGKVIQWKLKEKRRRAWHVPCYDTRTRKTSWLSLDSRIGAAYATPVQFLPPSMKIIPPQMAEPADQNWCGPIPRR